MLCPAAKVMAGGQRETHWQTVSESCWAGWSSTVASVWDFTALRHCFETEAGESRDQAVVNAVMGHVDNSMAAHYRERMSNQRLRAVVDHVHRWLFEGTDDVS